MDIEQFARVTNAFLVDTVPILVPMMASPDNYWGIDQRTVRFYHVEEVLSKPKREGKRFDYTNEHVRMLVAIKLLQENRHPLSSLKPLARKNDVREYDLILSKYGILAASIDAYVEMKTKNPEVQLQEPEEEAESKEVSPAQKQGETVKMENELPKNITISIQNQTEFEEFNKHAKFGSSFVFVDELPEEAGRALHRLIYGQRQDGVIKQGTLPLVPGRKLIVPGGSLSASTVKKGSLSIVCDKDVYKEGEDVAKIFVFDPLFPDRDINLKVHADNVLLETQKIKLDENGCGLVRIHAVCAGKYTVSDENMEASCSFEAARYSLDALTVTLDSSFTKTGDWLNVALKASAYSNPFNGSAKIRAMSEGKAVYETEARFIDGKYVFSFSVKDVTGQIGIQVMANGKVASVPLTGSASAQRDDDTVSTLGKVVSVSMVPSQDSVQNGGLFFRNGARNNSPIRLKSCISDYIELDINSEMDLSVKNACVMVTVPDKNGNLKSEFFDVFDFKTRANSWSWKRAIEGPFASIHVGAFVDGKPWEGHAVVFKKAKFDVSIKCEKEYAPNDTMRLKIRSKKNATILLRIADKRMRTQDTPLAAISSRVKEWSKGVIGDKLTGFVKGVYIIPKYNTWGGPIGVTGPTGARGIVGPLWSAPASTPQEMHWFKDNGNFEFTGFLPENHNVFFNQPSYFAPLSTTMEKSNNLCFSSGATGVSNLGQTMASSYVACGSGGSSGVLEVGPIQAKPAETRETECDLVHTGLIKVSANKDAILDIKLPDSIGEYDITSFAVSQGSWVETKNDFKIDRSVYISPSIPAYAHPDDEVLCRARIVGMTSKTTVKVTVDGKPFPFKKADHEIVWNAIPGKHEVSVKDARGNDSVSRIVECPGEELVLAQRMLILKKGETFNLSSDENALSVNVLPGMQEEFKSVLSTVTDFQHKCCEQTSAVIIASAIAILTGDDSSKEKAFGNIIKGNARLKLMYVSGEKPHFLSYPGGSFYENWSDATGKRLSKLDQMLSSVNVSSDVKAAVQSLTEMGNSVIRYKNESPLVASMERAYYSGNKVTEQAAINALTDLSSANAYDYQIKSEAAYAGASLIRDKNYESGIKLANACAKAMGGALGGAMHGSYETLSYLYLIWELKLSGIVSGGAGNVRINGKKMTMSKAALQSNASKIEALDGPVAIRISRLERIDFEKAKSAMQMSLTCEKIISPNSIAKLKVSIDEYKDGDVLCVALPDCMSRMVGGAKVKKFQLDFKGRKEIEFEIVAHDATISPQRWAAVVRNMYDSSRIGSIGVLKAQV